MRMAREKGLYLALNLLVFPGVTDREEEVERLSRDGAQGGGRPGPDPVARHGPGRLLGDRAEPRRRGTGAGRAGADPGAAAARPGLRHRQLRPGAVARGGGRLEQSRRRWSCERIWRATCAPATPGSSARPSRRRRRGSWPGPSSTWSRTGASWPAATRPALGHLGAHPHPRAGRGDRRRPSGGTASAGRWRSGTTWSTAPPATGSFTERTTGSPGWSPTATATSPC